MSGKNQRELEPPFIRVRGRIEDYKWGRLGVVWHTKNIRNRGIKYYEKLLKSGWRVNDRDIRGYTALHYAVSEEDADAIKYLVEAGGDLNKLSSKYTGGVAPIHCLFLEIGRVEVKGKNNKIINKASALCPACISAEFDKRSDCKQPHTCNNCAETQKRCPECIAMRKIYRYKSLATCETCKVGCQLCRAKRWKFSASHNECAVLDHLMKYGCTINHRTVYNLSILHFEEYWNAPLSIHRHLLENFTIDYRYDEHRTRYKKCNCSPLQVNNARYWQSEFLLKPLYIQAGITHPRLIQTLVVVAFLTNDRGMYRLAYYAAPYVVRKMELGWASAPQDWGNVGDEIDTSTSSFLHEVYDTCFEWDSSVGMLPLGDESGVPSDHVYFEHKNNISAPLSLFHNTVATIRKCLSSCDDLQQEATIRPFVKLLPLPESLKDEVSLSFYKVADEDVVILQRRFRK